MVPLGMEKKKSALPKQREQERDKKKRRANIIFISVIIDRKYIDSCITIFRRTHIAEEINLVVM